MHVRRTSAETYRHIVADGLLGRMAITVYACLYEHGPLTGRELDHCLARPGETRTSYHKRLPELRDRGAIEEVGERICRISGEVAIIWDVTDKLPIKPPKKLSKPERYRQLLFKIADHLAKKGLSYESNLIQQRVKEIECGDEDVT